MNLEHQRKYLQKFNEKNKKVDKELAKKLYISGMSSIDIAKYFDCSKQVILKALKNIPKRSIGSSKKHPSKHQYGENNPNWKGGTKSVYDRIRALSPYWYWRNTIICRDNNACVNCNRTTNLEVHHIKTLKYLIFDYCRKNQMEIKELSEKDLESDYFYDLNNGVTFCKECHKEHHKINGR